MPGPAHLHVLWSCAKEWIARLLLVAGAESCQLADVLSCQADNRPIHARTACWNMDKPPPHPSPPQVGISARFLTPGASSARIPHSRLTPPVPWSGPAATASAVCAAQQLGDGQKMGSLVKLVANNGAPVVAHHFAIVRLC